MALINVKHLTFSYEGSHDNVFENASFQLDTDWKLGFTGRNGRGKTTFLNLLMGKYDYRGTISSPVSFEYFPFDAGDISRDTIDVIRGVIGDFEQWMLERELSLLKVPEDVLYRAFETLSHGERTKVLLAALFLKENSYLLIDEPTNHLDAEARAIVSGYLKGKKSFILVSHDRDFLDNCIDHILAINKNNIEIQKGNFSSWWVNKQRQDDFEQAENDRLQGDIKRLSAAARRTADWSDKVEKSKKQPQASGSSIDTGYVGHKAAKMMKRSKNIDSRRQDAIEEKSKLLKNIESADDLAIKPLPYYKDMLVELRDVSIYYGGKSVLEDKSFSIRKGDRIVLQGSNGSGKSSILKLIADEDICYNGTIQKGSNLIISYVPQDTSFLEGNLRDYARDGNIEEALFKAILRKLDFSRDQFEKDMRDFSGGQKKKVLIAKSLCQKANLYIWDEPLNFIDVISRMQIEDLILRYEPTMLFVEHDAAFARNIATKTVCL